MGYHSLASAAGFVTDWNNNFSYHADVKAGPQAQASVTLFEFCGGYNYFTTNYALRRSSSEVLGRVGVLNLGPHDPSESVSFTTMNVNWNILPSTSSTALRRFTPITGGGSYANVIWTWPEGLKIAPLGAIVLFSDTGNPCPVPKVAVEIME